MPVYEDKAPGVYIETVLTPPAISGVSTSITAFLGMSESPTMPLKPDGTAFTVAPVGEWRLVTNFAQFTQSFGEISAGNRDLAISARGFFANGGSLLWVARVGAIAPPPPPANPANPTADEQAAAAAWASFDTALTALKANTDISIVAAPGALDAVAQTALKDHAEELKDRFVILDGQRATSVTKAAILGSYTATSDYTAVYFPWVQVADPTAPTSVGFAPPSGLMAGIYARVDAERGVHKAPANERIRGALGLEYLASQAEQSVVNKEGINVIRSFAGNIKVWGARTRIDPAENDKIKYIPVRRLMIFLSKSIDVNTQWVVFEPNALTLWQQIIRSVSGFLERVWRDGALFGAKREQAFYVICDESTNPPANRDVGIVTTEIGVAPVRPAEFVVFRIAQYPEIPAAS